MPIKAIPLLFILLGGQVTKTQSLDLHVVRFPGGEKAKLNSVREMDLPLESWTIDGRTVSKGLSSSQSPLPPQTLHRWQRSLEMNFSILSLSPGSDSFTARIDGVNAHTMASSINPAMRAADLWAQFGLPRLQKTADVKLGIGHGPFSRVLSGKPSERKGNITAKIRKPIVQLYRGSFRIAKPVKASDSPVTTVSVRLTRNQVGEELKLVCRDSRGRPLKSLGGQSISIGTSTPKSINMDFACLPSQIARVELYVRNYEWVTFGGVHLYPNGR